MKNYVSIHERQTKPNPALAAVHGQAALLQRYDMPTYSKLRNCLRGRTSSDDSIPESKDIRRVSKNRLIVPGGTVEADRPRNHACNVRRLTPSFFAVSRSLSLDSLVYCSNAVKTSSVVTESLLVVLTAGRRLSCQLEEFLQFSHCRPSSHIASRCGHCSFDNEQRNWGLIAGNYALPWQACGRHRNQWN